MVLAGKRLRLVKLSTPNLPIFAMDELLSKELVLDFVFLTKWKIGLMHRSSSLSRYRCNVGKWWVNRGKINCFWLINCNKWLNYEETNVISSNIIWSACLPMVDSIFYPVLMRDNDQLKRAYQWIFQLWILPSIHWHPNMVTTPNHGGLVR